MRMFLYISKNFNKSIFSVALKMGINFTDKLVTKHIVEKYYSSDTVEQFAM